MTFEEHRELGRRLHATDVAAGRDFVDLANRYGTSTKLARRARRVMNDLSELRSELDSQLCREHPDDFAPEVYYPGSSEQP